MDVTEDSLYKYFRGKASREEKIAISEWLEKNEENKKLFRQASDLYESFVMTAPLNLFETETSPERGNGKSRARRILYTLANVAAVAAVAVGIWFSMDKRYDNKLAGSTITLEIPAGHRMDITLEDGTVARLNSGAKLKYPQSFSSSSREVILEGEACFEVTRDERRPFVVSTGAADVEVLGTVFDVYADEEEFSTTLIEGSVKVTSLNDPGKSVTITPDHKVFMHNGALSVEKVDASESILWVDGILDISGTDFGKIVRKMENAYGVKIIVQRTDMPEIRYVGGKVRISDGIDHAMGLLSSMSGFSYTNDRQNGTIYIK